LWQHLNERERLLELGVDGKMTEMHLCDDVGDTDDTAADFKW